MEVLLLGTGGADGWPNPWCTCASCTWARSAGVIRRPTSALIDDTLLVDCGPEAPRAALQHGRSLIDVRHILLTHSHNDHLAPAALVWRGWAKRSDPIDVIGPPAAIAMCKDWVEPDAPNLRFREVRAGDRLDVGAYDVRVHDANHNPEVGPPVLYDITGPDGTRIFWGTDTGPLPDSTVAATSGVGFDAFFLEESTGDVDFPMHHTFTTWAADVARLRKSGAIGDGTRVVAIHLSHFNPPGPEVERRLAAWGAEVFADGAVVDVGSAPPHVRPRPPYRVLVLGGARSGKSREAERRLLAEPDVTYVATSRADSTDDEWSARIDAHRTRRPATWRTIETTDLVPILTATEETVLVDCLTLWLSNVMLAGHDAESASEELAAAIAESAGPLILVSNEVGSGIVPATPLGRSFRDRQGWLNQAVAACCDAVVVVTAGGPQLVKPAPAFELALR